MAAESCRIVSLTVTEKGYCHDPVTGHLDPGHPDIRHDLANPDAPRSGREIHQAPLLAAMNLPRSLAAFRTSSLQADRTGDDQKPVGFGGQGIDHQTSRRHRLE